MIENKIYLKLKNNKIYVFQYLLLILNRDNINEDMILIIL
jgi:hypothetical protein